MLNALLFGRHHVTRQHRQHRAVHGHGHTHLVQRNLVEQNLHVLDRVDRHTGLAHVAGHARVVGVVAAVRGQIERHRHALPAGRQRLAVKRVGFFGGRKTGVLANGPGPHRVHGGLRAAQVGLKPRQGVGVGQVLRVLGGVQRLDRNAIGRDPVQRVDITAWRRFGGRFGPGLQAGRLKFRVCFGS